MDKIELMVVLTALMAIAEQDLSDVELGKLKDLFDLFEPLADEHIAASGDTSLVELLDQLHAKYCCPVG